MMIIVRLSYTYKKTSIIAEVDLVKLCSSPAADDFFTVND